MKREITGSATPRWIWIPALTFTVIWTLFIIFVFIFSPDLTPDQRKLLRIPLAMLAGFASSFLTGSVILKIHIPRLCVFLHNQVLKPTISATGGIAIFIVVYFSSPFLHENQDFFVSMTHIGGNRVQQNMLALVSSTVRGTISGSFPQELKVGIYVRREGEDNWMLKGFTQPSGGEWVVENVVFSCPENGEALVYAQSVATINLRESISLNFVLQSLRIKFRKFFHWTDRTLKVVITVPKVTVTKINGHKINQDMLEFISGKIEGSTSGNFPLGSKVAVYVMKSWNKEDKTAWMLEGDTEPNNEEWCVSGVQFRIPSSATATDAQVRVVATQNPPISLSDDGIFKLSKNSINTSTIDVKVPVPEIENVRITNHNPFTVEGKVNNSLEQEEKICVEVTPYYSKKPIATRYIYGSIINEGFWSATSKPDISIENGDSYRLNIALVPIELEEKSPPAIFQAIKPEVHLKK